MKPPNIYLRQSKFTKTLRDCQLYFYNFIQIHNFVLKRHFLCFFRSSFFQFYNSIMGSLKIKIHNLFWIILFGFIMVSWPKSWILKVHPCRTYAANTSTFKILFDVLSILSTNRKIREDKEFLSLICGKLERESPPSVLNTRNLTGFKDRVRGLVA